MAETDDEDRIYILPDGWLRKNVGREPDTEPMKFELIPTDDPVRYVFRVTEPAPKFYIKRHGNG